MQKHSKNAKIFEFRIEYFFESYPSSNDYDSRWSAAQRARYDPFDTMRIEWSESIQYPSTSQKPLGYITYLLDTL
jgi:hypothetical protein